MLPATAAVDRPQFYDRCQESYPSVHFKGTTLGCGIQAPLAGVGAAAGNP